MRKLCLFTLGFTASAAACVFGLRGWPVCAAAAVFALLCAVGFALGGRKERIAAIVALGAAVGLLWTTLYRTAVLGGVTDDLGQRETLRAQVLEYPRRTAYGRSVTVRIFRAGRSCRGVLYFDEPELSLTPGDSIRCEATLKSAFDRLAQGNVYDSSRGVWLTANARGSITVTGRSRSVRFLPALLAGRMQDVIEAAFPEDTAPFIRAILLGDRSELSYRTRNELSIAGIYHVVAVSGLHVAILISFLSVLCAGNRRLAAVLGLPAIVFFVLMTGAPPSAVRAGIMQAIILLMPFARRDPDTPTTVCTALLALVMWNPWCIRNAGLQMSFGSTAGILLFTPRLYRMLLDCPALHWLRRKHLRARICRSALTALLCSVTSIPFSAPFLLASFGMISVIAPLVNMFFLWFISAIFCLSLAACVCGFVWLPAAAALGAVLRFPVQAVLLAARLAARVPYAAICLNSPYAILAAVCFYAAATAFVCMPNRVGALRAVCSFLCVYALCMGLCAADYRAPEFCFTALDVGQGQCLVYRCADEVDLIDCGGREDESGETAARFLRTRGIFRIRRLILTHFDADHVNGALQLMVRMRVDEVIVPDLEPENALRQALLAEAQRRGISVTFCRETCVLPCGSGTLTLFPPDASDADANNGVCVLAENAKYGILITGDLSAAQELRLLAAHPLPRCTMLVAGHHGSASSTCATLLEAVDPELVLISVGANNAFGHPAQKTLERIARSGAQILRTDLSGTITIRG